MKSKFRLIVALILALIFTSGTFVYTFTTASGTISITEPAGDVVTSNITPTQPDWSIILDDLATENKTCGEVPTGNIFTINPDTTFGGDLIAKVYLTNTGNLTKAYSYLNMKLYLSGSVEAGETPNYRLITLQNGEAALTLKDLEPVEGTWTQTSQPDFAGGTQNQTDVTTSPGNVILVTLPDNVTDTYNDTTKIASSTNVTVSGGQVTITGTDGSETLRPNAAGDNTSISYQYPNSGSHWEKVDETTADNYTSYVYTNSTGYQQDLYNIPDHSTGSGAIDGVTAYFNFARNPSKWGIVYRGPDSDGFLKTTEISSAAQIGDSTIDTMEWDGANGWEPAIVNVSGNIYAIAYRGTDADGWLATVNVNFDGNITGSVIDTMEWDAANGYTPDIVHVSGDIYAIAYRGTDADGWLATVEIDSSGYITNTTIDTMEWDAANGYEPDIIHVSGNYFAIAYRGTDLDGWLATVEIDSSGNITNATIDTMEWNAADGYTPQIIHISGDIYAIAYRSTGADGWLTTVEIDSSGNITDTAIDTMEWDAANGYEPSIVHVSGDIYAIAYRGTDLDGWMCTVEIVSNGNITNSPIDTYEWAPADGYEPNLKHVDGNFYAIVYRTGATNLGNLITLEIATDGQITGSIIDTLQFEATYGFTPRLIPVSGTSGTVYARAAIKSGSTVATGSENSTGSDTFVLESYQWTTNPATGQPWTWSEIDALQIGVELRTATANIGAACTQVYIVINHSYYPTGTVTSVNLLSGETVYTIDSFDYNVSAIPSGTGLQVQFSQNGSNWYNSAGTLNGWNTLSAGTHSINLSGLGWTGSNFYYHTLFTSDGSGTPVLDDITAVFSTCYTSGDLTSSTHDNGYDLDWDWGTISFTINEPSATNIQFQIRTAATEGGLSSATWYGPTGTGDYYTTSGTTVNSIHDGDRWIQYKAYFSGPGNSTPVLSDISITYSAQAASYTIEIIGGGYCLVSDNTSEWETGWTTIPEFFCEVTPR